MASQWFLKVSGNVSGPYSSVQLKQLAAQGRIDSEATVRRDDQTSWVRAGSIKGLFPADATTNRAVSEQQVLGMLGQPPKAGAQAAPKSSAATPEQWFVRLGDKQSKPMSVEQLKSFAADGKIGPDTLVRTATSNAWVRAVEVAEIAAAGRRTGASSWVEPAKARVGDVDVAARPPAPAADDSGDEYQIAEQPVAHTAEAAQPSGPRLIYALAGGDSLTAELASADMYNIAAQVGEYFRGQGYRLEHGTPVSGVYGTGNDALRILFGAFAKRFKFRVEINDSAGGAVRLQLTKGMSGAMGGLIGYNAMKRESSRIFNAVKSVLEHATAASQGAVPAASPFAGGSTPIAGSQPQGTYGSLASHRGGQVLVLALVSFFCFGFGVIFGPVAWFMAQRDLREIREGRMDPAGQPMTMAGLICAIISTVLNLLIVFLIIVGAAVR